jgi:hypoxanthine phosphoribosyltransferase
LRPLLNETDLRAGVTRLATEIHGHYERRPLTIIGVLTGSVVLLADLIRQVDLPLRVGVVQARSYRGAATRPGTLSINADLMPDVRDRDVLLLDDIFDTGATLLELVELLGEFGPASVRTAVLLRKHVPRSVAYEPDHVAFEIPNEFVVGYGLDYRDHYRHLPYVAALEPHELEAPHE